MAFGVHLKSNRGVSLLTTLIALGAFGAAFTIYNVVSQKASQQVQMGSNDLIAQSFTAELAEYFRAMSAASLESYLMTNPVTKKRDLASRYFYCSKINYLDRSTGSLTNPDPLADMPPSPLDQPSPACRANRWYKVEVVDRVSQAKDISFCSLRFGEKALAANQTYMVTLNISYYPAGTQGCSTGAPTSKPQESTMSMTLLRDLYCDYEKDPSTCKGVPPTSPVVWSPTSCQFRQGYASYMVGFDAATWALCPPHFGIFVTGNGNGYGGVCCALPATDILTGPVTVRLNTCASDEISIGSVDADRTYTQMYCQKINTAKYKLGAPSTSCVWSNSGTAGWGAASLCTQDPPVIGGIRFGVMVDVGTDGCTGSPYGALWVSRTSKTCGAQSYARLYYLDGTPVKMYAK